MTSTEAKPSACVGLDGKSQLVYVGLLAKNAGIFALVDFYSPRTIATDAPLSLPPEICCLEEDCPCQPELLGRYRQCDQELRQQGIPCYPTSKKTFIKDLIYGGIDLKVAIGHELKQASQVIDVYPFASKVSLFGKTLPPKTTNKEGAYSGMS